MYLYTILYTYNTFFIIQIHYYITTKNKLISSSRWPERGVSAKSALDLYNVIHIDCRSKLTPYTAHRYELMKKTNTKEKLSGLITQNLQHLIISPFNYSFLLNGIYCARVHRNHFRIINRLFPYLILFASARLLYLVVSRVERRWSR